MDVPAWVSSHTPSTGKALGTENVTYRSLEQERALYAVINNESPVIVVLLTGRGKSLTFIGPACLPQASVTIVVAPFCALEDNIITQCEEKGIECLNEQLLGAAQSSVSSTSAELSDDIANSNITASVGTGANGCDANWAPSHHL
ncbi:hypothetical protein V498_05265, partial [Pseudogymnoascus sp. VKM F-4517 (FW-2822)]